MKNQGFAVITALTITGLLAAVLVTYSIITVNNIKANSASGQSAGAIHVAEAEMNRRAEHIRRQFVSFATPTGVPLSYDRMAGAAPCLPSATMQSRGTGDLKCETTTLSGRKVYSGVDRIPEDPNEPPPTITIPAGEDFAGLNAEETLFSVKATAVKKDGEPEAIASMDFKSRLVPLFQFAIFFDKDLEFDNTAPMTLSGPVHTNGNLFLDGQLTLNNRVTSSNDIYRGHKQAGTCVASTVNPLKVSDGTLTNGVPNLISVDCLGKNRWQLQDADFTPFKGNLKAGLDKLEVPSIEELEPTAGKTYWDKADVRILLKQIANPASALNSWEVRFVNAARQTISVGLANAATGSCTWGRGGPANAAIGNGRMLNIHQNFRDNREAQVWENQGNTTWPNMAANADRKLMVDVNVQSLLNCMHDRLDSSVPLNDTTDGGLVIYFAVEDNLGTAAGSVNGKKANKYAFRLHNAATLQSNRAGAKKVRGLTFVTNQAAYIQGNFNSDGQAANWIPSAVMSDSLNILSNNWNSETKCYARMYPYYVSDQDTYVTPVNTWNGLRRFTPQLFVNDFWQAQSGQYLGQQWYVTSESGAARPTGDAKSTSPLFCRQPSETTIHTAILSGSATTGTGAAGREDEGKLFTNAPVQSGGVHNITRFHEDWRGTDGRWNSVAFNYRGSIVSFDQPLRAQGNFILRDSGDTSVGVRFVTYTPPTRNWGFEERFKQSSNLPPLTPKFVYLKQENMTRRFVQD